MSLPLVLGAIQFSSLETPQTIGPLGGKQVLVIHEYPGGAREVDDIGAFPLPLSWSGIFTGGQAFDRAAQIDRMRATAQEVTLSYGPQAFLGKVARFEYNPAHQFFIPYTIHFEPILDLSGIGNVPFDGISDEAELALETTALSGILDAQDGLALAASLVAPANLLLDAVQIGLLNGNGTVAGMSTEDATAISAAAALVAVRAAPLIAGPDPAIASPALDLSARAAAISIIVQAPARATRQFQAVNPNLFALAAIYFNGDTERWIDIAQASGLNDPQPVGEFTIVVPV